MASLDWAVRQRRNTLLTTRTPALQVVQQSLFTLTTSAVPIVWRADDTNLWQDHGFVFTREDGLPYRGIHVLQRSFYPLLERAGLPRIRLHDLRHTAATLLLLQNVPAKVVSELLGHSSVGITLDRYSHVLPSMQQAAAAAMERVLRAQ